MREMGKFLFRFSVFLPDKWKVDPQDAIAGLKKAIGPKYPAVNLSISWDHHPYLEGKELWIVASGSEKEVKMLAREVRLTMGNNTRSN